MLSNIQYWEQWGLVIFYLFFFIGSIASQGLACYKCMTIDKSKGDCADPFSSLINPVQINCQATSVGKNGTFPARFCVKISGRILSVDDENNTSYINSVIYYRTCVVDNIMESTKSLETTGNFRLKGFHNFTGSIRLQGSMSLCSFDGCNQGQKFDLSLLLPAIGLILILYNNIRMNI